MAVFDLCLWTSGKRGVIRRGVPGPIQIHQPAKTPATG